MSDIERLREVGEAATDGPWEADARNDGRAWVRIAGGLDSLGLHGYPSDAVFIATARNEWDALLDEVESLRGAVERVRALLDAWEAAHTHLGIERDNWGPSSSSLRAALDGPTVGAGEVAE